MFPTMVVVVGCTARRRCCWLDDDKSNTISFMTGCNNRRRKESLIVLALLLTLGVGGGEGFPGRPPQLYSLRPAVGQHARPTPQRSVFDTARLAASASENSNTNSSRVVASPFWAPIHHHWRRIVEQHTSSSLLATAAPMTEAPPSSITSSSSHNETTAATSMERAGSTVSYPPRSRQSQVVSAHLQLTNPQWAQPSRASSAACPDDNHQDKKGDHNNKKPKHQFVKVYTYTARDGTTWKALNTPKRKFHAFLAHQNVHCRRSDIVASTVALQGDDNAAAQHREEWRTLWKARTLITDRTELLAVYHSDSEPTPLLPPPPLPHDDSSPRRRHANAEVKKPKRGGFADLLHLYTERLLAIVRDERNEEDDYLVTWLRQHYGTISTDKLLAPSLTRMSSAAAQQRELKKFLEWFRAQFPYYYDRCDHCHASMKEEMDQQTKNDDGTVGTATPAAAAAAATTTSDSDDKDDDEHEHSSQTFACYVYPNDAELAGRASRTELYWCHRCGAFTRFPRYNSARFVLSYRRGRCGEYSMLLFRMLRALGHVSRWIVDWADHVWAEASVDGGATWIHLDPCEAAVNEKLIYQNWGKKQTFILGFYAPLPLLSSSPSAALRHTSWPWIEDVTTAYTTDSWHDICQRREDGEQNVQKAMQQARHDLQAKLQQLTTPDLLIVSAATTAAVHNNNDMLNAALAGRLSGNTTKTWSGAAALR